ncbi:transketolase [Asanoa ishikariensis]|uniref:Transketolase n=1 Tax=Asanoa ishikariensis TaxID=137265 RepID=A0A1H3R0R5_9ACTN|nr:transketolase [Asanoa ishikariensis]GIF64556.1 transketolase [Asanoa ishikariensis]SDZ18838.1 transketolase [Asanoa ishikariensis]
MTTTATISDLSTARDVARQLRVDSVRTSTSAGSGHPTSSMSAADLLAVLVTRHLRYDWDSPENDANDHLIFSKGHASPLLYSVFKAAGVISDEELMSGYRRFGQRLQGHPTPVLPWVDVATGSLGQGLPDGVGVALAGRYLDEVPYRVWVLCGDSEMAEGSMWEALDKAAYYRLSNLVAIVDVNRLGQSGPTELQWDLDAYARRASAFGARVLIIDGHDLEEIDEAYRSATDRTDDRPTVILARTLKGRGFSEVENLEGWHGKPLPKEMADRAIRELGGESDLVVRGPVPMDEAPVSRSAPGGTELPRYQVGDKVATRRAYGDALTALGGGNSRIVALDGEVGNSTYSEEFAKAFGDRYFEMYIAEQQMVAAAVGLSVRHYIPFASTFAAFLSRAYDFIRMASISRADIRLVGSHAGVEIGADGPSQMALEDLAMLRAVQGSTVLYPSDAVSTASLVAAMVELDGVSYLRATRGAYPVLYESGEVFPVGGSKVLRSGPSDAVTLVGAGVTLHECLAAASLLASDGIAARVIDLYSVKPVDTATLSEAVAATEGRIIVVEDHHPEGGLGSAVAEALLAAGSPALHFTHLAVRDLPGSGSTAEQLAAQEIDADHIAAAARALVS